MGLLTIGQVARRTGVSVSALRFYEHEGLVQAERTPGGQRAYRRDALRRISFIRIAQTVGLRLQRDELRLQPIHFVLRMGHRVVRIGDGGVILLLFIEGLMRKEISLPIKERIYQAAFVFLVLFAVMVIYNDLVKTLPGLTRMP